MLKKSGLGKGLGALIPEAGSESRKPEGLYCPIDQVHVNPDQPRKSFNEASLSALAETIRDKGVLQPLLVRKIGSHYELIAGERRLRAAKMAGLHEVPVMIRESADVDGLELAMIENLQREDLNPIEEACGHKEMLQRLKITQEELAQRMGKDRSSVANSIRLLQLPREIQEDLRQGLLTSGHARALLGLPNEVIQLQVRALVKGKGLSVRETEKIILDYKERKSDRRRKSVLQDPDMQRLQDDLRRHFGAMVKIQPGKKGGKIQIQYSSADELNRICSLLTR
jgi:ParB family transcriptional regulator, chromosome partitioning protein